MNTQVVMIIVTLAAFAVLAFMMSRSIKKHEEKAKKTKKKKGRTRYMPEVKRPGK